LFQQSPIERLLQALDTLDGQATSRLFAPDGRVLVADGRTSTGMAEIRGLLGDFLAQLRTTKHSITAEWNPEPGVWLAEVNADYELRDWLRLSGLPRMFVLRLGERGIEDLRVYGAREYELSHRDADADGIRVGGRWIPPL
jgi:hypothetical protein